MFFLGKADSQSLIWKKKVRVMAQGVFCHCCMMLCGSSVLYLENGNKDTWDPCAKGVYEDNYY